MDPSGGARKIEKRTGQLPKTLLADGNHAKHSCIEHATHAGVQVLIAVPKAEQAATKPTCPEVVAGRERMQTVEAKELYRARASLCELPNANLKRHQGLSQMLVRGLEKVTCVALLAAVSANIVQHLAGLLV